MDIVERLRDSYENWSLSGKGPVMLAQAAAEIEALRRENERLREALEPFAKYAGDPSHIKQRAFLQLLICPLGDEHPDNHVPYFQAAKAALATRKEGADDAN